MFWKQLKGRPYHRELDDEKRAEAHGRWLRSAGNDEMVHWNTDEYHQSSTGELCCGDSCGQGQQDGRQSST